MTLHKKIPWKELLPAQQIIVLQWMIDGLHQAVEAFIKTKSHNALVQSLHRGEKFDPEALWNSLSPNTQSHFEHSKQIMILLEKMIDDATERSMQPITKQVPLPAQQPDPVSKAEPHKKPKKKGKGGGKR